MTRLAIHTLSIAKTGLAGAPTATLHGTGMTAILNGGRMTALAETAGGSGMSGAMIDTG